MARKSEATVTVSQAELDRIMAAIRETKSQNEALTAQLSQLTAAPVAPAKSEPEPAQFACSFEDLLTVSHETWNDLKTAGTLPDPERPGRLLTERGPNGTRYVQDSAHPIQGWARRWFRSATMATADGGTLASMNAAQRKGLLSVVSRVIEAGAFPGFHGLAAEQAVSAPKRGRGRPRGSKNAPKTVVAVVEAVPAAVDGELTSGERRQYHEMLDRGYFSKDLAALVLRANIEGFSSIGTRGKIGPATLEALRSGVAKPRGRAPKAA